MSSLSPLFFLCLEFSHENAGEGKGGSLAWAPGSLTSFQSDRVSQFKSGLIEKAYCQAKSVHLRSIGQLIGEI
jgi:hypothetical protein